MANFQLEFRTFILLLWKEENSTHNSATIKCYRLWNSKSTHCILDQDQHIKQTGWIFTVLMLRLSYVWVSSYCSLKPLWSGMGEVVLASTLPTLHPPSPPPHCVSIVATSTCLWVYCLCIVTLKYHYDILKVFLGCKMAVWFNYSWSYLQICTHTKRDRKS